MNETGNTGPSTPSWQVDQWERRGGGISADEARGRLSPLVDISYPTDSADAAIGEPANSRGPGLPIIGRPAMGEARVTGQATELNGFDGLETEPRAASDAADVAPLPVVLPDEA